MTLEIALALLQVAAVVVAVLALLVTLKGIRDQLWIMIFTEYTGRYAKSMEALPFEARRPGGNFDLKRLSEAERERVLTAMRSYLNLCSEEFYLHRKRMLPHDTWSVWETGIRDTVRLPGFRDAWDVLGSEYDYFGEFRDFMVSLVQRSAQKEV